MFNFIKNIFTAPKQDEGVLAFANKVIELQNRIDALEIELSNNLYEIENRLEAKIDKIHPVVYNLNKKSLDDYRLEES